MAGDASLLNTALHNTALPSDVNGDGRVSSLDALAVINFMARVSRPDGESPATISPADADVAFAAMVIAGAETAAGVANDLPAKMVDVDNNGIVTAADALIVMNQLQAEGEDSAGYTSTAST